MALNLDPNNVKKKTTDEKPKQEIVTNSDNLNIKDRIEEYSDERITSGRVSETHKRATFLIDSDTLDKLQNLVDLIEATNSLESKYQDNLTTKQVRTNRLLAKGFKSKLINYALNSVMEDWESSQGLIPEVEKIKYKKSDGTYNRVFKFEENGTLYLLEQNNRGVEQRFMSTDSGDTKEEIDNLFNSFEDQSKREGRPRKK